MRSNLPNSFLLFTLQISIFNFNIYFCSYVYSTSTRDKNLHFPYDFYYFKLFSLILSLFSPRLQYHDVVGFFSYTGTRGNRLPSNSAYLFWLATRTIADAGDSTFIPICSRGLPSVILRNLHFLPYLSPTQAFS